MGCNCGNKTSPDTIWVFVDSQGAQHSYTSKLQADAAKIRAGGQGSVKEVVKV